jgi:hypothetical protein
VAAAATLRVLVPRAPSPGHGQARPESRPAVDREAAANAADDDAPPGWGQMRVQPALAPERLQGVLVMREDICVMSGRPTHGAGASTSHAASPAPTLLSCARSRGCAMPACRPPILTRPRLSRHCGRSFETTTPRSTMR